MDEMYDSDICMTNTNKGPVIEAPNAADIDLSERVNPLTSTNIDEVRASSKRLHESIVGVSEFIQPTLACDLCLADAASLVGGISGIAESVKPLSALNAVEGITTVSDMLPDLVSPVPALADVFMNNFTKLWCYFL